MSAANLKDELHPALGDRAELGALSEAIRPLPGEALRDELTRREDDSYLYTAESPRLIGVSAGAFKKRKALFKTTAEQLEFVMTDVEGIIGPCLKILRSRSRLGRLKVVRDSLAMLSDMLKFLRECEMPANEAGGQR